MTTENIAPAAPAPDLDDGLTEAEREAYLLPDDDDAPDGAEDDQDDQEQDDAADEQDPGNDVDGAAAAADVADATDAGRDDGAAAEDGADEPGAEAQPAATPPVLVAAAPADLDVKLADIATKKEALIAKFDDGDITAKEYQTQLDVIGKEERAIERQVDRAEIAAQMDQQRIQNDWSAQCAAFLVDNPAYSTNQRLHRALDQEVRDIGNSEAGSKLTGPQILATAHANLVEAGMVQASAKPAPGAKPTVPKVAKPSLPPNLARVPAAETDDASGGKFASLERLATTNPLGYEEALMKMSDGDRRAYLAA